MYEDTREAFIRAMAEAPHIFSERELACVQVVYVERKTLQAAGVHFGRSLVTIYAQIRRARIALDWWLAHRDAA
jgi:hypothetical protein